ncbi:Ssp120p [Sugiyamaella lignohabitans]|uniref:Ssp120p n=1 Tax=Sugiyamaella lignohabitans TaxID=796027 RepID=A0A167FY46_9ASCO|nr:Ssp120p [Sugiyamaella lignohabitans]ANB15852.1 Ssp120p [Sugiyamaella lignohabitans]
MRILANTFAVLLALGDLVSVNAADGQTQQVEQLSWQVRHMKEEHGFDQFDALSFFTLHDSDGSKTWTSNDILNLYGLLNDKVVGDGTGMGKHEETENIPQSTKDHVLKTVLGMIDTDNDGIISLEEWRIFTERGGELPDFGLGPGHHGDYEYEYEVHHWLEHHAKDDPDVKNVHPEDIEHENLFHAHEHGDDAKNHEGSWEKVQNIPLKYRKQ